MFARSKAFIAAPLALWLGGCSLGGTWFTTSTISSSEAQERTTGLAVADEPYAARAGAAILGEGGSAADAAAAMFFALSATYPVAAGLGASVLSGSVVAAMLEAENLAAPRADLPDRAFVALAHTERYLSAAARALLAQIAKSGRRS